MNRIATGQVYNSALLGVLNAQNRQAEAGRQLASGVLAPDLKGYAGQGTTLVATQTVLSRTDTLIANNRVLVDRLAAQDGALTGLEQAVTGSRKAVADAVASGDGQALLQKLQGWLGQAVQSLNADFAGQPLFAGGTTDQPPVDAHQLSDLIAPNTVAGRFHDGTLVRSDRIDEATTLPTSFRATEIGKPFLDALAAITAYDQPPTGPFGTKLTEVQIDFLKAQLAPLDAVAAGVRSFTGRNGVNQARVDATNGLLTGRASAAEGLIDSVTAADPAETATRLQLAGVALQASAQVFSSLTGSSLLDVLRR